MIAANSWPGWSIGSSRPTVCRAAVVAHDLEYLEFTEIQFPTRQDHRPAGVRRATADHDAVFLGAGMGALQTADFPGKSAEGVVDVSGFPGTGPRRQVHLWIPDQTVVIIGGGNVALDAAVVAKRSGAREVIVLYRRSRDEMPGWESEYLEATRLGVEFRWLSTLAVIEQNDGKVQCGAGSEDALDR